MSPTKKVVNIINGIPSLMYVPANWEPCSVSGEFLPPEEFMENDKKVRTNRRATYNMPYHEYMAAMAKTAKVMESSEYKSLMKHISDEMALSAASISVRQMKEYLSRLEDDDRLLITQEGYYADGKYADIFTDQPPIVHDGVRYYTIGHSSQNY